MSRYLPVLLISVILGGHLVSAQVTTGTISGVVQDSSGAVIPGVAVTARNTDTRTARTVTTDEGGRYTAPELSLGNYEVQAQLLGFQTEIRNGIRLTVGREAVVNLALKVGQVSDTVTITGEAPLVESTTATLSALVDERTIRDLPLNGRSYDKLALLQPGVVIVGAGQAGAAFDYGKGQRFSVSGSRPYANSFVLDGTGINDHANATPAGAAGTNLGVDGIREFQIITNVATAETGFSTGGVISAVTRSGSNEMHGSVFEFLRNNSLDTPGYFDGGVVAPLRKNQFGGALGGPIKKDKTFFFGTYEGLRQSKGTSNTGIVPTALAKQGILPSFTTPVSDKMKPYLALYPDPNGPDYGDGTGPYVSAPAEVTRENYVMGRIDHHISDKMRIFGRYSYDKDTDVIPSYNQIPIFDEHDVARRQYSTLQVSNVLRPTLVNSLRFSFNRTYQLFDDLPHKALDPSLSFIPGQFMGTLLIGTSSGAGGSRALSPLGVDNGAPRDYKYNLMQVGDDLSFVKGSHTLKVGTDIRRLRDNEKTDNNTRGTYTFDSFACPPPPNPNSCTSSLLAATPSADTGFQAPAIGSSSYRGLRETMVGVYGQDDFKMTQRLTLNLGLRWEGISDPREVNGKMANLLNPMDPAMTVLKDHYFAVAKKDFQPRAGLAWQLNKSGTTVLRAGFGIFHDHILPYAFTGFASNNPPFFVPQTADSPSFPDGYRQLSLKSPPRATAFPTLVKEPVKNSYSLSLQHELMKDTLLEVAYLGSVSHHLEVSGEQNTPVPLSPGVFPSRFSQNNRANPNFASVQSFFFGANANYNGLQVTLKRRSASGLQYQAAYTYSKSLDTKSSIAGGETRQETVTVLDLHDLHRDYARSSFDAQQNLVVTTTYPFPFHFQQKALGMILGGWIVNGIGSFRAGAPFTARVNFNRSANGDRWSPDRPNLNTGFSNNPTSGVTAGCTAGGVTIPAGEALGTPKRWFDPCAFSLPAPGTYGNLGRNTLTGPGLATVDGSLQKVFKPSERIDVQFRAEVFNLFNRANFYLPGYAIFASSGAYIGGAGRIGTLNGDPRQIQFALKVTF
ncbi:MAG TPA: TonB-dependent receptor [Terriglobia bacterium]|nr:TonB-dependent receptor [Terriglobia bacterium]